MKKKGDICKGHAHAKFSDFKSLNLPLVIEMYVDKEIVLNKYFISIKTNLKFYDLLC